MARIETDPNYTTPTFSRATAGTDVFKKEDVQGVSAALSTHDHASGKGLAVTRIGVLTDNITFGTAASKVIGDALIFAPLAAGPNSVNVVASSGGTGSSITLWPGGTTSNSHLGQIAVGTGGVIISAGLSGTGTYQSMQFATGGTSRLTIGVDGTVTCTGQVAAASVAAATLNLEGANNYIGAASGTALMRNGGGLVVQGIDGTTPRPIDCGNLISRTVVYGGWASGSPTNAAGSTAFVCASSVTAGPRLVLYDAGSGSYLGLGMNGAEINMALGPWGFAWRKTNSSGVIVGGIDNSGNVFNASNLSPAALTTQSGSYAISTKNSGSPDGQVLAFAHPTYACVDHAREAQLPIGPIADATQKVLALQPYDYPHINHEVTAESDGPQPVQTETGELVISQTYGFAASEVYATIPEAAALDETGAPIGVDSYRLLCVLWASVQDLTARLASLEVKPI